MPINDEVGLLNLITEFSPRSVISGSLFEKTLNVARTKPLLIGSARRKVRRLPHYTISRLLLYEKIHIFPMIVVFQILCLFLCVALIRINSILTENIILK